MINAALQQLCPGAEYILYGNSYVDLIWQDNIQTKPTEAEINTVLFSFPLNNAKEIALTRIKTSYQNIITADIAYMGTTFQADKESQILLDGAVGKYTRQGSVPVGFWWKDASNNHISMSLAQLQGLADAIGDRIWNNFQILDARKTTIRTATTISQVEAIVW